MTSEVFSTAIRWAVLPLRATRTGLARSRPVAMTGDMTNPPGLICLSQGCPALNRPSSL